MFTFDSFLFYLFGGLAILTSFMVINSKNSVYSVLFLILVFMNSVGLLLLLEVEFLAMTFLIVYVGAIAVLFLFVVMMLNLKIGNLNENIIRYLPIGSFLGFIFILEIFIIFETDFLPLSNIKNQDFIIQEIIGLSQNFTMWATKFTTYTNMEQIGQILYTYYIYLFILSGFILLVSMIGAIVLTMHQRKNVKKQKIYEQINRNFETAIYLKK
jgi:NADH-quinone oxidoreductase subunit J